MTPEFRKSQVVANERTHCRAAARPQHQSRAAPVVPAFMPIAERMDLVIEPQRLSGRVEQGHDVSTPAVGPTVGISVLDEAGKPAGKIGGEGRRCLVDDSIEVHAEPRIAQFRKEQKIAGLRMAGFDKTADAGMIGRLVFPGDIKLDGKESHWRMVSAYAPPMRRAAIVTVFLVLYTALMYAVAVVVGGFLIDPPTGALEGLQEAFDPRKWGRDPQAWMIFATPTFVLVASQVLFLLPVVRCRPELSTEGRPLWTTLVGAGAVAAVLTMAMLFSLLDLILILLNSNAPEDQYNGLGFPDDWWAGTGLMAALLTVSWLIWSALLMVFCKPAAGSGQLGRWIGLLLQATIFEVLITIPIDIMVRRRSDCYCSTASFFSICCSTWAFLWLTGPGIMLGLTSKRRRLFFEHNCHVCHHPRGPTPGARCPECGNPWGATPPAPSSGA